MSGVTVRAMLLRTTVQTFPPADAEPALDLLRAGSIRGAAVLIPAAAANDR